MKKYLNELTELNFLFILDYRRLTTSSRRGLVVLGEVQGVARAYPCPRLSLPPGDAPQIKSDRLRHRRINRNLVSFINPSLSLSFDINFPRRAWQANLKALLLLR